MGCHLAGNLNVGKGRQVLIDVLTQLLPFLGYPRTLCAPIFRALAEDRTAGKRRLPNSRTKKAQQAENSITSC